MLSEISIYLPRRRTILLPRSSLSDSTGPQILVIAWPSQHRYRCLRYGSLGACTARSLLSCRSWIESSESLLYPCPRLRFLLFYSEGREPNPLVFLRGISQGLIASFFVAFSRQLLHFSTRTCSRLRRIAGGCSWRCSAWCQLSLMPALLEASTTDILVLGSL